jgi:hypothetical protein
MQRHPEPVGDLSTVSGAPDRAGGAARNDSTISAVSVTGPAGPIVVEQPAHPGLFEPRGDQIEPGPEVAVRGRGHRHPVEQNARAACSASDEAQRDEEGLDIRSWG